jgi:SAM-dependent methyltransferase
VSAIDLRGTGTWPKQLPEFTDEQRRVRDEFMARWLEILPSRYGMIERFNHTYGVEGAATGKTLEIGAGLGEHLRYEDLTNQDYYVVELREELTRAIRERYPTVTALVADCQDRLPFDDAFFDRVLAVHVLEHLPDLPRALDEIQRVLSPGGRFHAVIPCEGGLAYSVARRISAQRIFEKEFGMSYEWLIRSEHVNVPWEIQMELEKRFRLVGSRYFPFRVPSTAVNLVIGLSLEPLVQPAACQEGPSK